MPRAGQGDRSFGVFRQAPVFPSRLSRAQLLCGSDARSGRVRVPETHLARINSLLTGDKQGETTRQSRQAGPRKFNERQRAAKKICLTLAQGVETCKYDGMTLHEMTLFRDQRFQGRGAKLPQTVSFHRTELNVILPLYGRMVAAGEWCNYGISNLQNTAIFSIFRETSAQPLYRIEKWPRHSARQGTYQIVSVDGRVLRRGNDLERIMQFFERKLFRVVD